MKHNTKITILLLSMFILTQVIGLIVIKADIFHVQVDVNGTLQNVSNPQLSWINPPQVESERDFGSFLFSLVFAFFLAIMLLFFLTRIRLDFVIRGWFFVVIVVALFLTIYAFEKIVPWVIDPTWALIIPLVIAVPLAWIKIYRRNFVVHNSTELLIYPGIASIFVPILNIWTIVVLLILISIYDMWAVWHSGFMQKMAKYQMNNLKIFGGFFVPYMSKKQRQQIKNMKKKYSKKEMEKKKIKVNLAILGGGDIVFPIITAGVMYNTFGSLIPSIFVIVGATLGLGYLFFLAEKKKFYPAMPFITVGIFASLIVYQLIY